MSEAKLQIKYEGEKISLSELAKSIKALEEHYILYTNAPKKVLYVKRVSEGSLVFEICENIDQTLPIFLPPLQNYTFFLLNTLNNLLDLKKRKSPSESNRQHSLSSKNFISMKNILSPVVNISFGGIHFKASSGDKIIEGSYNSSQLQKIKKECQAKIKELNDLKLIHVAKEKVELIFLRASNPFLLKNKKNTMGIVRSIAEKPKRIIFKDEDMERRILGSNYNILNYKYVVDIEILTEEPLSSEEELNINEVKSVYKILHVYDTIEAPLPLWKDSVESA